MAEPILKVVNLKKHYPICKGMFNKQVATRYVVDGIDIEIEPGKTVALVGESGWARPFCCASFWGSRSLPKVRSTTTARTLRN